MRWCGFNSYSAPAAPSWLTQTMSLVAAAAARFGMPRHVCAALCRQEFAFTWMNAATAVRLVEPLEATVRRPLDAVPQSAELITEVESDPNESWPQPQRTDVVTEINPDSPEGQDLLWRRLVQEGVWIPPMPPIARGDPAPALRQAPPSRRRPNGEPFWFFLPQSKARGAAPYSRRPPRRRF